MASKLQNFNGPAMLAAMFRELDPAFRKKLADKLEKAAPMIARIVEEFEFLYSDIFRLEDKSLQTILRTIPEKDWLVAWKLTDEPLRERLLMNMSKAKREEFEQLIKKQPRILKNQVMVVQMRIAKEARKMLQEGKLRLKSKRLVEELRRAKQSRK